MGQLNIKDEALIADARALAELLGTSTTDAVRRAVQDRLAREQATREEERQRRYAAIMAAAGDLREALGGQVMSNAELDEVLYDPETGLPR